MRAGKRFIWAAAVAAFSLATVGCGTGSSTPTTAIASSAPTTAIVSSSPATPIQVGVVTTQTGPNAVLGVDTLAAINARAAVINNAGGILGRQLNVTFTDSASNPNQGLLAAKQLLSNHVDLLIPDNLSLVASGIFPVSTQNKTITIANCSAAACGDGKNYPYEFEVAPLVPAQALGVVAGMEQVMNGAPIRIGQLGTADSTGQAFVAAIATDAKAHSDMSVVSSQTYTAGAADLSVQLSKLQAANANVIAVSGNIGQQDVQTIINNLVSLNYTNVTIVGVVALLNTPFYQLTGPPALLSRIYALSLALGVRTGDAAPTDPRVLAVAAIDPKPVSGWEVVVSNQDSLTWYQWAVTKTGGTDPDKISQLLSTVGTLPTSELPTGLIGFQNPGWSGTDHSTANADYSHYWGFVVPSPVVDGTYKGILLSIPKS